MTDHTDGAESTNPLTWLYTHCRAIGMTCKSDSGKFEQDISLFTTLQKRHITDLQNELSEQARLLGMSAEREARLLAIKAELEKQNEALRDALKHLVHNIKATGKRLDLGVAMDRAEAVIKEPTQ